ncbi:MAG: L,D-transpeptidase family protein [Stellaceae bacterium]
MKELPSRRYLLSALGLGLGAALLPQSAVAQMRLHADKIVIIKHRRLLLLMQHGHIIKSYPIALGPHPRGPKEREGDGRTPEGYYIIDYRTRNTPYYLALHLSYPNAVDRMVAAYFHTDPGGAIYIHGLPDGFADPDPVKFFKDWTEGCIAVSDPAIREIWDAVPNGTEVVIKP